MITITDQHLRSYVRKLTIRYPSSPPLPQPSRATGMPSNGMSGGQGGQSDVHHSSGGINSQRQCAQQASLVPGLKECRARKNQVGSLPYSTMMTSINQINNCRPPTTQLCHQLISHG